MKAPMDESKHSCVMMMIKVMIMRMIRVMIMTMMIIMMIVMMIVTQTTKKGAIDDQDAELQMIMIAQNAAQV